MPHNQSSDQGTAQTALVMLKDYFLIAMNKSKISMLMLLDLSAAFDIVDHNILLTCQHDVTEVDYLDCTFPEEVRE